MNNKILFAEDDTNLGVLLKEYLEINGFEVHHRVNGKEALELYHEKNFDLCIFDVMMPVIDGFTLAKEIRKGNEEIPIVFLTAKSLKEDIVEGLKLGADDYITKPFSMNELLLRVRAILKRVYNSNTSQETQFEIGSYKFDYTKQELVFGNENPQSLTTKESDLLRFLCEKKNEVLDRSYALKKIWGVDNFLNTRSMDVYILKLRKYLSKDDRIKILNVHGKGFKLLAP